jgi:hypothetical protein
LDVFLYGSDDIEDDLDFILFNAVSSTILKWRTFKLLRWVHFTLFTLSLCREIWHISSSQNFLSYHPNSSRHSDRPRVYTTYFNDSQNRQRPATFGSSGSTLTTTPPRRHVSIYVVFNDTVHSSDCIAHSHNCFSCGFLSTAVN